LLVADLATGFSLSPPAERGERAGDKRVGTQEQERLLGMAASSLQPSPPEDEREIGSSAGGSIKKFLLVADLSPVGTSTLVGWGDGREGDRDATHSELRVTLRRFPSVGPPALFPGRSNAGLSDAILSIEATEGWAGGGVRRCLWLGGVGA
jgi:hypothetical protein